MDAAPLRAANKFLVPVFERRTADHVLDDAVVGVEQGGFCQTPDRFMCVVMAATHRHQTNTSISAVDSTAQALRLACRISGIPVDKKDNLHAKIFGLACRKQRSRAFLYRRS